MKRLLSIMILSVCVCAPSYADNYANLCEKALEYYLEYNWSPKTGLVYTCSPDKVRTSEDCVDSMFHWYKGIPGGYGAGMGDCALIMGTALSGTVDKALVTKDRKELKRISAQAALLARGMLNLATRHGVRGFVARGICVDDGKSICSLSSVDQFTHWEHSLWRYSNSPIADRKIVEEYRKVVVEVAQFLEGRVTQENGWNFGLADGTIPDPRGICTLWGDKKPHAAARLAMFYCATYLATGDTHWRDMYERYIDRSIEMTLVLKKMTEKQVMAYMPAYALYQAMCSLELILSYEQDPVRRAGIEECMAEFSRRAHVRAMEADPAKPPYGMCWDGELLLTQMMDVNYDVTPEDVRFLEEAVLRKDPMRMGWCRAAHIYAAYWRYQTIKTK